MPVVTRSRTKGAAPESKPVEKLPVAARGRGCGAPTKAKRGKVAKQVERQDNQESQLKVTHPPTAVVQKIAAASRKPPASPVEFKLPSFITKHAASLLNLKSGGDSSPSVSRVPQAVKDPPSVSKVPQAVKDPPSSLLKTKTRNQEVPTKTGGPVADKTHSIRNEIKSKPEQLPLKPKHKHHTEVPKSEGPRVEPTVIDREAVKRCRRNHGKFARKYLGAWSERTENVVKHVLELGRKNAQEMSMVQSRVLLKRHHPKQLYLQTPMMKRTIASIHKLTTQKKARARRAKARRPSVKTPLRVGIFKKRDKVVETNEIIQRMKRVRSPGTDFDSPMELKAALPTTFNFVRKIIKQPTKKLREAVGVVPQMPSGPVLEVAPLVNEAAVEVQLVLQTEFALEVAPEDPVPVPVQRPMDKTVVLGVAEDAEDRPQMPSGPVVEVTPVIDEAVVEVQLVLQTQFALEVAPEDPVPVQRTMDKTDVLGIVEDVKDREVPEPTTEEVPVVQEDITLKISKPRSPRVSELPVFHVAKKLNTTFTRTKPLSVLETTYEIIPDEEEMEEVESTDVEKMPPPQPSSSHRSTFKMSTPMFDWQADREDQQNYDITLIGDYDDDYEHREEKPIPEWAQDVKYLVYRFSPLFINEPTRRRVFPQGTVWRKFNPLPVARRGRMRGNN